MNATNKLDLREDENESLINNGVIEFEMKKIKAKQELLLNIQELALVFRKIDWAKTKEEFKRIISEESAANDDVFNVDEWDSDNNEGWKSETNEWWDDEEEPAQKNTNQNKQEEVVDEEIDSEVVEKPIQDNTQDEVVNEEIDSEVIKEPIQNNTQEEVMGKIEEDTNSPKIKLSIWWNKSNNNSQDELDKEENPIKDERENSSNLDEKNTENETENNYWNPAPQKIKLGLFKK